MSEIMETLAWEGDVLRQVLENIDAVVRRLDEYEKQPISANLAASMLLNVTAVTINGKRWRVHLTPDDEPVLWQ